MRFLPPRSKTIFKQEAPPSKRKTRILGKAKRCALCALSARSLPRLRFVFEDQIVRKFGRIDRRQLLVNLAFDVLQPPS